MSTICSPKACTSSSSTYLVVLGESKTIYYKETEKTRYGILLLVYNLNSTFKKGAHENTLSNFSGVYAFEDAILEVVSGVGNLGPVVFQRETSGWVKEGNSPDVVDSDGPPNGHIIPTISVSNPTRALDFPFALTPGIPEPEKAFLHFMLSFMLRLLGDSSACVYRRASRMVPNGAMEDIAASTRW
jgi:hypothetical protein